ncbi:hypothetical protein ABBQ38_009589 [Trebouxia sp. C0009 RCD-2024]
MANRTTGVDEAIKFIWDQPDTVLQSSEKQRLSAALAKETDVVARRYFLAPLPEQCVGTLKELLAPTGETGPESSWVLTAVLESLDARLHTIELGVKLSTYQTKVRLRYSASKASNESRPDNKEFKLALIRAYQPQQELKTSLFCMVTGVEVPKENIVGAHIASHSKRTDMECLLLIKNIDDVQNGMLWSQPIENAYEDSRICFAFHPADGEYRLHVLDSALLGLSLAEPFPHHSKSKAPLHANKFQAISWQDVDGKCIQFGTSCTRPFKRAFTLHAYLAWDLQTDRQCLPDSFDARGILTSQWSCDEVSEEVMQWLASTIPNALGTVAEVDNEVDLEEDDPSGVSS